MTKSRLVAFIQGGLIVLVAIMPFHAFLSVWGGHLIGHQAILQSWKEVLLLALICAAILLISKEPARLERLRNPTAYCFGAFVILALIVTIVARPEPHVVLFGIKTDIEFLVAAALAWIVCDDVFRHRLIKTVLIGGGGVIGFGLAQIYLLPTDWLSYFGYGPTTISPYQLVDPAVRSIRILSTLGGPNQLGSFLILPLAIVIWQFISRPRWWHALYLVAGVQVMFHSYSRGAWLGMVAATLILVILRVPSRWRLGVAVITTAVLLAILMALIATTSHNSRLAYYVLHQSSNNHGFMPSTTQHLKSLGDGLTEIKHRPLGTGLGTAGPASFHGNRPFIPESYYLQLAVEAGILGALLFVSAELLLAVKLWRCSNLYAPPVLAALAGIAVVNLFLHGWADSSTALVFWTVAGGVVGSKT